MCHSVTKSNDMLTFMRKVTEIVKILSFLFIFLTSGLLQAKQEVDLSFVPNNKETISKEKIVLIDEAHHNFHTLDGRYQPFAKVLESAGFTVRKNTNKFTAKSLENVDILVIANALNEKNVGSYDLPNYSAFSQKEVEVVHHWVKSGGSLLLIADHFPWPKASDSLASTFGFQFNNSYVEVLGTSEQYFEVADESIVEHKILKGLKDDAEITKVRGFMGQAFLSPPEAKPLLVFKKKSVAYMPSKAWDISDDTPTISAVG